MVYPIKTNKFSFCDLSIEPAAVTTISSRRECNPYYFPETGEEPVDVNKRNGTLPIFTAPMDSVCDDKNYKYFLDSHLTPIVHRYVPLEKRCELLKQGIWCGYSLDEVEKLFCNIDNFPVPEKECVYNILIDNANGHMQKVLDLASKIREVEEELKRHSFKLKNIYIMAGNIASPEAYIHYCKAGIDYVRCSIGTGSMCLTQSNAAVGYPNASLIYEINAIRDDLKRSLRIHDIDDIKRVTKIIADGGIKNYSDAIIAYACGADYVMIGGIMAGFLESCAEFDIRNNLNDDDEYDCQNKQWGEIKKQTGEKYIFEYPYTEWVDKGLEKEFSEILKRNKIDDVCPRAKTIYGDINFSMTREQMFIEDIANFILKYFSLMKTSHGMSTKEAQIQGMKQRDNCVDMSKVKTSEGKTINHNIQYTAKKWTENFTHYLQSAMSYTNKRDIKEFVGNVRLVERSYGTMLTVNK